MAAGCLQIFLEEFFLAWSSNQGMLCPSWAPRSKDFGPPMPAALENQLNSFMVLWLNQANLHGQERMAASEAVKGHNEFCRNLELKTTMVIHPRG